MTNMSAPIDPHRPWIRDLRDDPSQMNWIQTLFNPFGMTGKLHFSRAWTFMFMGRVILFIGPVFSVFIAGLAGADLSIAWKPLDFMPLPVPALLVPFFFFTIVTEFTSWVAHVRRFADANRSTLRAMFVLMPLMLALAGFAGGVTLGSAQFQKQQAETAKAAAEKVATAEEAAATGAAATETKKPQASNANQGQRGRRGPPPTEMQMAIQTGMSFAIGLWALTSFLVMLRTLLHVARMPNGGVGDFRTGSDIPQGETEPRPYEPYEMA